MNFRLAALSFLVVAMLSGGAGLAQSVLKGGDVIAVCGDSITEQKVYSAYIEEYILMCQSTADIKVMQCGWGGANALHFSGHMKNDVLTLAPTVATTSYGMNDGGYDEVNPANDLNYREGITRAVEAFKHSGTRVVIVGSPGVVDTFYFKNPHHSNVSADAYNQTLGHLGEIARELAAAEGVRFADVHGAMMQAMAKAKAGLGPNYPFAGDADGVHAGPPGHLVMAYAYLKAMGFDGSIGTITFDAGSGKASATSGHRIVSSNAHEIVVESSRYPFCFFSGTRDADKAQAVATTTGWAYGNAAVLPFVPFNQDLNRYSLIVHNLKSPRARITWGEQSREFTAAQLAQGINLAAEFLKNPFVKPFMDVSRIVEDKQAFETTFIRDYLSDKEPTLLRTMPAKTASIKAVEAGFRDIHKGLLANCAQAVKPVTHTIRIEELQ